MKFYVIGDEDVVLGFKFIGIEGSVVDDAKTALNEFCKATENKENDLGVLIITEKVASMIEENIINYQLEGNYPLIVELPDLSGHIENKKTMIDAIREAIGLHI
jgi:V/A-type H+-transporting ATPase subunit F